MVSGMATRKITITLQEQQIDEVRALVAAGAAANVSAFAQHAIGVALSDAAGWREMLEDERRRCARRRVCAEGRVAPQLLFVEV